MKNLKYSVFVTFLGIVTTLLSCNKSDEVAVTSFDKILQGTWAFDSLYTINGQSFVFSDLEKETELIFFEDDAYVTDGPYYSKGEWSHYFFEDEKTSVVSLSSEKLHVNYKSFFGHNGKDQTLIKLSNPNGFQYTYSSNDYASYYIEKLPNIVQIFCYRDDLKYANLGYTDELRPASSNQGFLQSWGYKQLYFQKKNPSNSELQMTNISDFDYFSFIGGVDRSGGIWRAKIKELTSSTLKLTVICNLYNRGTSTYRLLDKVEVSLKKKGAKSGTITIAPFDITKYAANFWEKCEAVSSNYFSSSSFKNGAIITSGGIDNKCLNLPNANSYVEFQRLLKKNTTLSLWIKPDDVSKTKQFIATKYKNQYGPYILSLEGDKFTIELNNGSGVLQKVQSGKSITKGFWNHICLSIDNDNLGILYINGVRDSKGTLNSVDYDAASKALIGTTEQAVDNGQTDKNFKGSIDEIIQFSSVITEGEIYQLYKWHLTN